MKRRPILESSVKIGITLLTIIMCFMVERPSYAYDTPVTIGPDFLEEDEGDGVEEPANSDEAGDPPLNGDYSIGGNVHYKMAMNSLTAQYFQVRNGAQVEFWAPKIVLKPGFHAKPDEGDGYFRAGIPVFDVNCINMVNPEPLTEYDSVFSSDLPDPVTVNGVSYQNFFFHDGDDHEEFSEFCENEIAILNHHFANEAGGQLIRFRLKNAVEWQWDLTTSTPTMPTDDKSLYYCLNTGDSSGATMVTLGGPCTDAGDLFNSSNFADATALTMIYYRYPNDSGNTSSGTANSEGAPYVLINYKRSDTALQAPDSGDKNGNGFGNGILDDDWGRKGVQEHEMGHAFWVQHTWDEGVASNTDDSNIMNYGDLSTGSSKHPDHDTTTGRHKNLSGYDSSNNFCSGGQWGNREIGFWFEPFNGATSGVCHRWVNGKIDYNSDGNDGDNNSSKRLWSQVEIIYYAAKHYKKTWAP